MAKQTFTTGQVLTAAQMTSLQQTAMLGGAASAKTASYTLVAADAGTAVTMDNAGATTITVDTGLFAAGDTVHITNLGAGVCTITAGTATVNSSASLALAQYESGFLDFTSTSAAIFVKGAGGASGGMTLLSTTTLSGASTTVSGISTSYIDLVVQIVGVTASTANGYIAISPAASDSISYQSQLNSANTTVSRQAANYILANMDLQHDRTNANNYCNLNIYNYSTAEYKSFKDSGFYVTSSATIRGTNGGGGISTGTAMTSIKFTYTGGNWAGGTVRIYGVK